MGQRLIPGFADPAPASCASVAAMRTVFLPGETSAGDGG